MTPLRLSMIAVVVALFAVSCGPSSVHKATNAPIAKPTGTIHIDRVPDAEAVLAQLGLTSYVFKHQGGELTSEFTIYHRPAGKDQTETVIFESRVDGAIVMLHANADRASKENKEGGYLIVAIPEDFKYGGNVTHSLSVAGAFTRQNKSVNEIYPETFLSHSGISDGGGLSSSETTIQLTPGETNLLASWHTLLGTELPIDEREMVRYDVTVTALKDGQLPGRSSRNPK